MKGLSGELIIHTAIVLFKRGGITQLKKDTSAYLRSKLVEISKIQLFLEKRKNNSSSKPVNNKEGLGVLLITSGNSFPYRSVNQIEQLALNGVKSDIKSVLDINLLNYVDDYDIFIFQRITYSKVLERMINKVRQQGKITIYEVDDLMFDTEFAKHFKTSEVGLFYYVASSTEKILSECDYALTTTDFLAQALKQKVDKVIVNRICPSSEQYKIAEDAIKHRVKSDRLRIGYFSGTNTHDYDFMEATPALLHIMEKYKHVDLYLTGFLTISPKFERFGSRVKRLPIASWRNLPHRIAQVDIGLAPLEIESPYCQSKSELKYIEAAMLGIPTIASATEPFKFAISHGENGLLANNTKEWIECLELLINDEVLRNQMGEKARKQVKDYYDPQSRGKQFMSRLWQVAEENGYFATGLDKHFSSNADIKTASN